MSLILDQEFANILLKKSYRISAVRVYIPARSKTLNFIFSHTIAALDDFLPQNSEIFFEKLSPTKILS